MGTAEYIAPEQARDSRAADQRADLYSLGCTLHFLLTGNAPFQGGGPLETMLAHLERSAPELSDLRSDVSRELAEIHHTLLRKDPAERFASATDLIAALDQLPQDSLAPSDQPIPPPIQTSQSDTKSFDLAPTFPSAAAIEERPPEIRAVHQRKSGTSRRSPAYVMAIRVMGVFGLLLTVIVVISRQDWSISVVDDDRDSTTIRIGSEKHDGKGRAETPSTEMSNTKKTSLPDDLNISAKVERVDPEIANVDIPSRQQENDFAGISKRIGEIRDEIDHRNRAKEFGDPPDIERMQEAANRLVAEWQRDGRLPSNQMISIQYGPDAAFRFTATKGGKQDLGPKGKSDSPTSGPWSQKARGGAGIGGGGGSGGGGGFGGGFGGGSGNAGQRRTGKSQPAEGAGTTE